MTDEYPYDYPHTAVMQINFSLHRKNPDGSLFPSAISDGNATKTFTGDNYEECLAQVRQFFSDTKITHNEKN